MKVLLGVATFPVTDETPNAVYPQTLTALEALDTTGHEVVLRYYGGDDPKLDAKDNLTNKHGEMRQEVLDGDFDCLLTVEADVIPPSDALVKLAAVEADVVYAAYCSRSHPMVLCFPTIDGYRGRSIGADAEQYRGKFGAVIPSEGVGFGCTLIHRRVLEQVEFRRDVSSEMKRKFADDWTFALDVKAAGFKSAHHLGVLCGHIQRDGRVRVVDPSEPDFMRIEGEVKPQHKGTDLPDMATYRVRRPVHGPGRDYKPGETIELGAEAAAILLARRAIESI